MKCILNLFKFQFSTLNFDRFNLVYIYHKKRYIVGLGLCGDYFCDFLCGNCGVGFICGVIVWIWVFCGFDMVAGVGVVVVIVWGGGCCDGDCVGDGCEKK